ncbi:MTAP family purine nucleoside phosphorylase [Candidatus Hodarchaeum mangrovi]
MNQPLDKVCVIGGSGFYDLLSSPKEVMVTTPFDKIPVHVLEQDINGRRIFFLPRHGGKHSIPPHKINYKANIFALYKLGVKRVLSTNAVGSLNEAMIPGDYVILNDFIDFAFPITFFEDGFEITFNSGKKLSGVIHLDMSEPYCPEVRNSILKTIETKNSHPNGSYARTMGPRFETKAEILAIKRWGADVVGMTNPSEAILSRELGICYATIAVVTNYAAGLQKELSHQEVLDIFNSRLKELKILFFDIIKNLPVEHGCNCARHIKN